MAIVIHDIGKHRYAYEHYRVGPKVKTDYIGPVDARGNIRDVKVGEGVDRAEIGTTTSSLREMYARIVKRNGEPKVPAVKAKAKPKRVVTAKRVEMPEKVVKEPAYDEEVYTLREMQKIIRDLYKKHGVEFNEDDDKTSEMTSGMLDDENLKFSAEDVDNLELQVIAMKKEPTVEKKPVKKVKEPEKAKDIYEPEHSKRIGTDHVKLKIKEPFKSRAEGMKYIGKNIKQDKNITYSTEFYYIDEDGKKQTGSTHTLSKDMLRKKAVERKEHKKISDKRKELDESKNILANKKSAEYYKKSREATGRGYSDKEGMKEGKSRIRKFDKEGLDYLEFHEKFGKYGLKDHNKSNINEESFEFLVQENMLTKGHGTFDFDTKPKNRSDAIEVMQSKYNLDDNSKVVKAAKLKTKKLEKIKGSKKETKEKAKKRIPVLEAELEQEHKRSKKEWEGREAKEKHEASEHIKKIRTTTDIEDLKSYNTEWKRGIARVGRDRELMWEGAGMRDFALENEEAMKEFRINYHTFISPAGNVRTKPLTKKQAIKSAQEDLDLIDSPEKVRE